MAITPYLYYKDVDAALKWLAGTFGFKRNGVPMRGPDGTIKHAAMRLGDDLIMMGAPGGKYRNPRRLGQATQSLYVTVKNADKQFTRAKKAGGKILEEPHDTEYGQRRCGVEDPEGHQWYFAHILNPRSETRSSRRPQSPTT
jgi:uncharacterized glyoxalase superfamily protein PhnB